MFNCENSPRIVVTSIVTTWGPMGGTMRTHDHAPGSVCSSRLLFPGSFSTESSPIIARKDKGKYVLLHARFSLASGTHPRKSLAKPGVPRLAVNICAGIVLVWQDVVVVVELVEVRRIERVLQARYPRRLHSLVVDGVPVNGCLDHSQVSNTAPNAHASKRQAVTHV